MGTYRRKLDIIADILAVAGGNAKKTQIMYKANLSYAVMQKYLAKLMTSSLIEFQAESNRYTLTEKGRRYLEEYQKYSYSNKLAEKSLNDVRRRQQLLATFCSKE